MLERLANKHIVLGVTGSIAAYKAADIVRRLREAGSEVRVVMTRAATEFVTPMTFQALSGNPVHLHLLDAQAEAAMGHISLARWADAILVAPASADFLARLRQGRADDLLSAVCLAGDVPLAVAPAMNQRMWSDRATQENIQGLKSRGILLFGPEDGSQACGETGVGRLQEPLQILTQLAEVFSSGALDGLRVLLTAGPTREPIDPVRYISNHSSGKMGYAIAQAAAEAGARVTLISGPVALSPPPSVLTLPVVTALQMFECVVQQLKHTDIFIATAAVADYRVTEVAPQKIKKTSAPLTLQLSLNPDILGQVKQQAPHIYCVGFAAETEQVVPRARIKLQQKGVEMIAANQVGGENNLGGFSSDNNSLTLCTPESEVTLALAPKAKIARELITHVARSYPLWRQTRKASAQILRFGKPPL
ncbi:MAG: bifunctional phosphopantothenoylcysteine decarboxylase/phosphopantothenate--cysteine ligase CoaBC [Gammaproteobacteria bacterium]|nr:bifunctional phosphopantothenoylcysteine decarboxylase/phosphopantothenate--cysteine ligase CoaBC [Gammaproteobacteria bacterium]